jgi:hypothetical protein
MLRCASVLAGRASLEATGKAENVKRVVRASKHTIYAWKAKHGEMDGHLREV